MMMFINSYTEVGMITFLVIMTSYLILTRSKSKSLGIVNDPEKPEDLEEIAKQTSLEHSAALRKNIINWPITKMDDNYRHIAFIYRNLNTSVMEKRAVTPAAEWLLDNFYIIEEQAKGIKLELTRKVYDTMPDVGKSPFKGKTRVFSIAIELVSRLNGQIDTSTILKYLNAYQTHSVLLDREIWLLPTMIRIALIENIRQTTEVIYETQKQWNVSDKLFEEWVSDENANLSSFKKLIKGNTNINLSEPHFIEHLFFRLRRIGRSYSDILRFVDGVLQKNNTSVEILAQKEHDVQAKNAVSMENAIKSLKYVAGLDWTTIFESVSRSEAVLREDPLGTYTLMDMESRNHYRRVIESMGKAYKVTELEIAEKAVALAKKASLESWMEASDQDQDSKKSHVGYYFFGKGKEALEKDLDGELTFRGRLMHLSRKSPGVLYMGSIMFITMMSMLGVLAYTGSVIGDKFPYLAILAGLLVFIPTSEMAVALVTRFATEIKDPAFVPKLLLKEGIPKEMATVVAMPALLTDKGRVMELMENMEEHYLANEEENLYFALVGAFGDSDTKKDIKDNDVLKEAFKRIKELNKRYSKDGEDIFFFYNRIRTFSESDDKWIGWERKRGALLEFNEMLLGSSETSFSAFSSKDLPSKNIRYVITLDADSGLPLSMAKKMIGTMAHPLNRPVVDEERGIVTEGYGLMQPRISFDMDSSNKSTFSRIYTGQEGIDPYASAISDVYQDLFEEGIYTGKGIYDLRVFQSVLQEAIPENMILSHDLLEGSYVRAGLATDLQLVDSYPSKYNSYMKRLHRWMRGDWQLLPWLWMNIYNKKMEKIRNPLTYVSIWKIVDNLRRSLLKPALMVLLFAGFSFLPGRSYFYAGITLLTLFFPVILGMLGKLLSGGLKFNPIKRHIPSFFGLRASFFQFFLSVIFLPYEAYISLSAIGVTLFRVIFSKKKMLEWVTFEDAEKTQKDSLESYIRSMGPSSLSGVILALLAYFFKSDAFGLSLIFLVIAFSAPFVAYFISKDTSYEEELLPLEDLDELGMIARKTWRYFEEFSNAKNNYLAPDNFQVDPPRGVTNRTSSTNIGLGLMASLAARDFGYLGIVEMFNGIDRTISTIGKMEKWNGHLYNWYETKTLKPMIPRYVSTVDSGNLVGYFITLARGLEDYYARPLVDMSFVKGLRDTLRSGVPEGEDLPEVFDLFGFMEGNKEIDLSLWKKSLDEAILANEFWNPVKPIWKAKVLHMLVRLEKEIQSFFPWIVNLENMPESLYTDGQKEDILLLLALLKKNVSLKSLEGHLIDLLMFLGRISETMENSGQPQDEAGKVWLLETKEAILQSKEYTEIFIDNYAALVQRIEELSEDMEFNPLFNDEKKLFSIGYDIETNTLTNSYYDMLASEARQTSYIAIARGEVPSSHWFRLGRSLTLIDRYKGLVSWSGTMFEYLMPLLIMKGYDNTLLDETYSFVIRSQIKYGHQRKIPWGVSESCFNSLDVNLDYQYKANGVPWLGLKRGLVEDAVIAPYASFLALMVSPHEAFTNLMELKREGLDGPYGYYEAIDYTKDRLTLESDHAIIKTFMAHHQGMVLLSIDNYLNDKTMQKRFSDDPQMKAASLLLQEKVPHNVVFTKENKEKIPTYKTLVHRDAGAIRKYTKMDRQLPKAHVLSNGNYSVMVTDMGTGYSRNNTQDVSRYRIDPFRSGYGMFFYIRDVAKNHLWSATAGPLGGNPLNYSVVFTPDKASFERTDGEIITSTEIVVATGDSAEIRRIKLNNTGDVPKIMEVTSYFEPVLATNAADMAHPAFNNLFIMTEFNEEYQALIANKRPRSQHDSEIWLAHFPVIECETTGNIEYETDRSKFLGRGNSVHNPSALLSDKPLSNTTGPVLDPIMSLKVRVNVDTLEKVRISFVTAIAYSRENLMELLEKYSKKETCDASFLQALTRSQVETRYLNIKADEMVLYQDMISLILFSNKQRLRYSDEIKMNKKGQSSLWPYGISGDKPIVMVIINSTDDVEIIYQVQKAHEYWRLKEMNVDLLIYCQEEASYTSPLYALIKEIAYSRQTHEALKRYGDVFIINANTTPYEDFNLFCAVSCMIFKGGNGTIEDQLGSGILNHKGQQGIYGSDEELDMNQNIASSGIIEGEKVEEEKVTLMNLQKEAKLSVKNEASVPMGIPSEKDLQFFNGLGGFSEEGDEYLIRLENGQMTPAPWTNVISNPDFGFVVTEAGGGFTWSENSRENKISPWSNDPITDQAGEILYISDDQGDKWTITPLPIREEEPYTITHGFGYTEFKHHSHGIHQSLVQFVPVKGTVKLSLISLLNEGEKDKEVNLTYFLKPVLGVNASDTAMHLRTAKQGDNLFTVVNPYNMDFPERITFMKTSEKDCSAIGDRKEFFGSGRDVSPDALNRVSLSNNLGIGNDTCLAVQVKVKIKAKETRDIVFLLGMAENLEEAYILSEKYKDPLAAKEALSQVKMFWEEKLQIIKVRTPDAAMDLMLNGWFLYQVIACRMWARAAFYQVGGAFGFRDQLQDSLSLISQWPEMAKEQILRHARHQFKEGDALHWWHEPKGKGTRTRISDDYLWLPYVTAEYLRVTGDNSILNDLEPFLEEEPLNRGEDERYCEPAVSSEKSSLYEHCLRALDHAMSFGVHGLPLMGSGDWNDGMNTVGNKGKGESSWLGWFLCATLDKFIPILRERGETERADSYLEKVQGIREALDTASWDGEWYNRAFFDNGKPLGSISSSECKIDSIAQSWAVISGLGEVEKSKKAMDSVENYLVMREEGLIKLFTPPFDKDEQEPGYIKGYIPGVRENGGQYSHAAAWSIIAFSMLGEGNKATELFGLLNPVNHARTDRECHIYKVEPYVMAADVYSNPAHMGRGGWTWYTGSASWMYKAGTENILGFQKNGDRVTINPCISEKWERYDLTYRYKETTYEIRVSNPENVNCGVSHMTLDGKLQSGNEFPLLNDGKTHIVLVDLGEKIKEWSIKRTEAKPGQFSIKK